MKPARRFGTAVPALLALVGGLCAEIHASAKEGEPHLFTSKNGLQISAVLLDVSGDRKLMTIRRDDGQQFQTEITSLSLDDQQYVKEWLKSRVATADYRIELEIRRKQDNARRRSVSGSMNLEDRRFEYEVTVRNLSRETLAEARLEYHLVIDEQVTPVELEDGGLGYSLAGSEGENLRRVSSSDSLEPLAYNREILSTTVPLEVHRILFSSGVYREDQLLGAKVRLLAPDGGVLAEASSGTAALDRLGWEALGDLPSLNGYETEEPQ